ncbi:metal-dependent hydrolase [Halobacterium hubeiense]|uniref:metal-dependent hydrolase n=1 Tax=Halobacterium hubeiense TaxID=1407499 RepID=UPI000B7F8470|nr:metal-dependent hydrolase [Halobacterium hubeiense]
MWPWGHLAVGYLCYVLWARRRETDQQPLAVLAVGVGSQLPDLIDKPLAWTVTVLPSGRSFAHSLFTAFVLIAGVAWLSRRFDRPQAWVAFAIGYLTHTIADLGPEVFLGLLTGDLSVLRWTTYLGWPLLPAPPYPNDSSFLAHLTTLTFDPFIATQFVLFGIAVGVWLWSGASGLRVTTAYFSELRGRTR